jgi:hypothetical protein
VALESTLLAGGLFGLQENNQLLRQRKEPVADANNIHKANRVIRRSRKLSWLLSGDRRRPTDDTRRDKSAEWKASSAFK